jgi:hypothetical protein
MRYFQHKSDAIQDEKLMKLFVNCGYEGIGLYWTALEKLAKLETPIEESILKKMLFMSKRLEKTWEIIKSLELFHLENGEIFCESLMKYAGKYEIKKEKIRERIKKFREQRVDNEEDAKNVTRYTQESNAPCNADVTLNNKEEGRRNKEINTKVFIYPTLLELEDYFFELGLLDPKDSAARFFDYYESIGWKIGGKSKMKDWRAACRNWKKNEDKFKIKPLNNGKSSSVSNDSYTKTYNELLSSNTDYGT